MTQRRCSERDWETNERVHVATATPTAWTRVGGDFVEADFLVLSCAFMCSRVLSKTVHFHGTFAANANVLHVHLGRAYPNDAAPEPDAGAPVRRAHGRLLRRRARHAAARRLLQDTPPSLEEFALLRRVFDERIDEASSASSRRLLAAGGGGTAYATLVGGGHDSGVDPMVGRCRLTVSKLMLIPPGLNVRLKQSYDVTAFNLYFQIQLAPLHHGRHALHRQRRDHLVARAVALPRPLQHLQSPLRSGVFISDFHPWAAVLPRPFQHLRLPAVSGHTFRDPTGSRAPEPTSEPPSAHIQRPLHTYPHTTGSHAPSPTSTPPGTRPQRQSNTCTGPTGSGAPAPTSTPSGARPERRRHKLTHYTGSGGAAPAPTS